ncbi:MAG: enolase C-terminal domain-like protein [Actinomycetota bacterium]|nr:enolase C-terminal domain-like protein [Actinomycetota bacterium]
MAIVTAAEVVDLRFPTSAELDGSDAMNPDPDYSAAYLRLRTSDSDLVGHGFVFTIGRGNDVQATAVATAAERFIGRDVDGLCGAIGDAARELAWDSQLRWLGPDKGVMHMAAGAVISALWDLRARRQGLPLWAALLELEPKELVDLVDWTYLRDDLHPDRARELLEERTAGRAARLDARHRDGLAAYTTSPGWLGYDDAKLDRLCREAVAGGFGLIKLKVGHDLDDDRRRLAIARAAVGDDVAIAVDANQRWGVDEAIDAVRELASFDLRWVEEPTHPDDVAGHATIARAIDPVPVATGEHLANAVLAKQLLQLGGARVLQVDATRVGGPHEILAMLLLAAHHGVDVCPHAGGVGLCELVQHYAFVNAVAIAADPAPLVVEYVDHLHEHLAAPIDVRDGRYHLPDAPGGGGAFRDEACATFAFPDGRHWASVGAGA